MHLWCRFTENWKGFFRESEVFFQRLLPKSTGLAHTYVSPKNGAASLIYRSSRALFELSIAVFKSSGKPFVMETQSSDRKVSESPHQFKDAYRIGECESLPSLFTIDPAISLVAWEESSLWWISGQRS